MKTISINFILAILFFLAACGNDKSSTNQTKVTQDSMTGKTNTPATDVAVQGDGITGTWRMYLDAFDKNDNQVLDEEERKNAVSNKYKLQLNADGTCRIQDVFNGTYKVKEEGGKKILEVQRKKVEGEETEDPIPDIYHIKSLTPDEMILLTTEAGSTVTFWIFKREK
jgi:hypothetical protein